MVTGGNFRAVGRCVLLFYRNFLSNKKAHSFRLKKSDFWWFAAVRRSGKVLPGYIFKRKSEFTFYIDYTN